MKVTRLRQRSAGFMVRAVTATVLEKAKEHGGIVAGDYGKAWLPSCYIVGFAEVLWDSENTFDVIAVRHSLKTCSVYVYLC